MLILVHSEIHTSKLNYSSLSKWIICTIAHLDISGMSPALNMTSIKEYNDNHP